MLVSGGGSVWSLSFIIFIAFGHGDKTRFQTPRPNTSTRVVHQARMSFVDTDDKDDNVQSSADNLDDFDLTAF